MRDLIAELKKKNKKIKVCLMFSFWYSAIDMINHKPKRNCAKIFSLQKLANCGDKLPPNSNSDWCQLPLLPFLASSGGEVITMGISFHFLFVLVLEWKHLGIGLDKISLTVRHIFITIIIFKSATPPLPQHLWLQKRISPKK